MGGGGGGRRCCVRGLAMGFPLVVAERGVRGRVRRRGVGVVGVSVRPVVFLVAGGGVWGWHCWGWGRGWVLRPLDIWVSCRVLWVVCGCVGQVLRPLAGRFVEVGGGCLGFRVELRFVGSVRLLVGGARRQGLRFGGRSVVVEHSMLALVLLVCMPGPLWVYGGAWWPECCGPVQWGQQVVLDHRGQSTKTTQQFTSGSQAKSECCWRHHRRQESQKQ